MCYSGQCIWENKNGECTKPANEPYDMSCWCYREEQAFFDENEEDDDEENEC